MLDQVHPPKPPIFTHDFVIITLINFIVFFCFQMIFPILPLYVHDMGGSDVVIGLVLGVFTFSTLIARPLTGYMLDRISKRKILLLGLMIFVTAMVGYGMVTTIVAIMMVRVIHGFGWGISSTSTATIASELVPKSRFGEGMGYFSLANSLAMAMAPAFGIYVGLKYGDRSVFLISSLVAFSALLVAMFLNGTEMAPDRRTAQSSGGLYEKKAILPGVLLFFTAMAYGGVISFLPLYAAQKGINDVGAFFVIYALSILITRPTVGKMVDRFGFDVTIIPGLLCLLVSLLLLAELKDKNMLWLIAIIYGIGFGAMLTSLQTMAVRDVERDRIGAANATLFTGNDFGVGIGVMILGAIAEVYGYGAMYLFAALPLGLALVFYVFYVRQNRMPKGSLAQAGEAGQTDCKG